jgi:hypothetical protein
MQNDLRLHWLCLVALACSQDALAQSGTTIFLSRGDGDYSNLNVSLDPVPTSETFDIWVRTPVQLDGISLDLLVNGSAILVSAVEIHNPASAGGNRWFFTSAPPQIRSHEITSIDAFAFVGIAGGGSGIGPATSGHDPGYSATIDAFKFATISYFTFAEDKSELFLRVGNNILGNLTVPLFLGLGDAPVANKPGETSALPDGVIQVGRQDRERDFTFRQPTSMTAPLRRI